MSTQEIPNVLVNVVEQKKEETFNYVVETPTQNLEQTSGSPIENRIENLSGSEVTSCEMNSPVCSKEDASAEENVANEDVVNEDVANEGDANEGDANEGDANEDVANEINQGCNEDFTSVFMVHVDNKIQGFTTKYETAYCIAKGIASILKDHGSSCYRTFLTEDTGKITVTGIHRCLGVISYETVLHTIHIQEIFRLM